MALFEALLEFVIDDSGAFQAYLGFNAWGGAHLINFLGYEASSSGTLIQLGAEAVRVQRGCDGVQASAVFAIAVLTFPAPLRLRLVGATMGTALLLAMNVLRVASLAAIRVSRPDYFETAHLTILPAAFILAATVLWVLWISWILRFELSKRIE